MCPAVVDAGEYQASERVERTLGRPADEQRIQGQLKSNRQLELYHWLMTAFWLAISWMLVANSVSPLVPTGLITAALLVPALLTIPASTDVVLRNRAIAKAVARSESWTSVPMTLFPWQRGHYVAGIAELPDGPALVRFPRPWIDVVANIADTKVMWIAGTYKGILAVGVPGTNLVTFAEVRPAAQSSSPLPWWHRYRQPDFSALPR
jgi:hypothetical protein